MATDETPPEPAKAEHLLRARRALQIFGDAGELEAGQRAAFVAAACGADHELQREVEGLLAAASQGDTGDIFPPLPALAFRGSDGMIGRQIGPYQIERLLGEGGMGVVYQGRRADIGLVAAIKVVRYGAFASADQKVRLNLEGRALARLQHPNIARLYDAGLTEEGLPYLAMELVAGTPLDRYCDERCLGVEARLRLFETVCTAVDHAHQNQVVHRDLKPSNVFVTPTGEVKLLDFGIAKLLFDAEAGQGGGAQTETGMRLLTPDYAAPEQFAGEAITTRTDVYSLGVVLYELLAGKRPDRQGQLREGGTSTATFDSPTAPSAAVAGPLANAQPSRDTASRRSTTTERLRRRLRGDLDTIVLKALRPEPGHRYSSARELALDITLHLLGHPISARTADTRYRLARFVRRHRSKLAIALLLFGAVSAATVTTIVKGQEAAVQRDLARRAGRDMITTLADGLEQMTGPSEPRLRLLQRAASLWAEIEPEGADAIETDTKLAGSYARLGANTEASAAARRAEQAARARAAGPGAKPPEQLAWARALMAVGEAAAKIRQPTLAMSAYQQALGVVEALPVSERTTAATRHVRERALSRIAYFLLEENTPKRARPFAEGALAEANELLKIGPRDVATLDLQATALERVADAFYYDGRSAEGCARYREALGVRGQTLALAPADPRVIRARSIALQASAWCHHEEGHGPEARDLYQQASDLQRRLHQMDPANIEHATALMGGLAQLADLYNRIDDSTRALSLYGEAMAVGEAMRRGGTSTPQLALKTGEIAEMLARALRKAGQEARARDIVIEQTKVADEYLATAPNDVAWLRARAYLANTAGLLHATGPARLAATKESWALFGRVAAITQSSDDKQRLALAHYDTALALRRLGNAGEAEALAALGAGRKILLDLRAANQLDANSPGARVYLPAIEKALRSN